jgi:hypothetical protein
LVKKGQKKPDPTAEELEFIFQCLADNKDVQEEIQGTTFPLRSKRFVAGKRREWEAAKSVLKTQLEREIDSVVIQSRMEHRDMLVAVTSGLLMNNLNRVLTIEKGNTHESEYFIKDSGVDSPAYPITKEQLSSELTRNIEMINDVNGDWRFNKCFLSHLGSEFPDIKIKGICKVAEEHPLELIHILMLLGERKTFKGKCPVCENW